MSSFNAYLIGAFFIVLGLAYGAFLLGVPPVWIGVGVVVSLGFGIISAVTHAKRRDLPEGS